MPRMRVIVLNSTQDDPNTFNIAMWADVPTGLQSFYASSTVTSIWPAATTTDIANLRSGSVVETVTTQRFVQGTGLAAITSFLQGAWNDYQTAITSRNPWRRSGSTWDGTTWVVANNT